MNGTGAILFKQDNHSILLGLKGVSIDCVGHVDGQHEHNVMCIIILVLTHSRLVKHTRCGCP